MFAVILPTVHFFCMYVYCLAVSESDRQQECRGDELVCPPSDRPVQDPSQVGGESH